MVVAAPAWWVGLLLGVPVGASLLALVLALCEMAARGDRPYDQESERKRKYNWKVRGHGK